MRRTKSWVLGIADVIWKSEGLRSKEWGIYFSFLLWRWLKTFQKIKGLMIASAVFLHWFRSVHFIFIYFSLRQESHCVDHSCLELKNPPASASQVLGLQTEIIYLVRSVTFFWFYMSTDEHLTYQDIFLRPSLAWLRTHWVLSPSWGDLLWVLFN